MCVHCLCGIQWSSPVALDAFRKRGLGKERTRRQACLCRHLHGSVGVDKCRGRLMYFGLYVFGVRGDQRSLGGPPTGVVRWRYFLGIFIVWAADWCRLGRKKGTWVDGCAADGLGCCRFKEGWGASMAHHACTQTSKMISALLLVLMESRDARVYMDSAQKKIETKKYKIKT